MSFPDESKFFRNLDRPVEDLFFDPARLSGFQLRLCINLFEYPGHTDEDRRSHFSKIVRYFLDRLSKENRHPVEDVQIHCRAFENMCKGEHGKGDIVSRKVVL